VFGKIASRFFVFCNLIIMENFILAGFGSQRHGNGQTTPERGEMFCLSLLHHLS
jgi:hypothetical protein